MTGAPKQEPSAAPPSDTIAASSTAATSATATFASCDEVPAPLPPSIVGTTLPLADATPGLAGDRDGAAGPANSKPVAPREEEVAPTQSEESELTASTAKVGDEITPKDPHVDPHVDPQDVDAEGERGRGAPPKKKARRRPAQQRANNVRKLRQAAMMSKAELARRAGVSPLTINRVENGWPCRMDTKRKILEALGLSPSAREEVFGPEPDAG